MTSIKKKPGVAIAAAIALVGSALFAIPANAATATLTVNGSAPSTAGTSTATAITLSVPASNSVEATNSLKIALANVATGSNVVVSATNAKVVTTVTSGSSVVKADAGVASLTIPTGTGSTADLYVYTTTTATGTVTVTANNVTTTYYVKGVAGPAYNLAVSVPATVNIGGTAQLTATVTDAFGNEVTNATITTIVIRGTVSAFSYDSTDKRYEATLSAPSVAGTTVMSHTITATAVTGFAKPVSEVINEVAVADLAGQVAALQAQITALKAELEATKAVVATTTKQYNDLAVRWNRKLPGTKWDVELIK